MREEGSHCTLRFFLRSPTLLVTSDGPPFFHRKKQSKETARGLQKVVEERGGVIELLQTEVEELKAALTSAESRPSVPADPQTPAIDPHLGQELEKV